MVITQRMALRCCTVAWLYVVRDVVLDSIIDCPLCQREIDEAVFYAPVGNRRRDLSRLEVAAQKLAGDAADQSLHGVCNRMRRNAVRRWAPPTGDGGYWPDRVVQTEPSWLSSR